MSKTVSQSSGSSPTIPSALSISINIAAATYSRSDCSSRNSCDHSTLYPTFVASMQGRGIFSSSRTCTVFSSMIRDPPSHARTMFCASCPCGPAAGPSGVEARWPCTLTDRSRPGSPRKKLLAGRSKIFPSRSNSRKARCTRRANGMGLSSAILFFDSGDVSQRESRVELRRLNQMLNRNALDHAVRDIFLAWAEADRRHAHCPHRSDAVGAEDPLVHHRRLAVQLGIRRYRRLHQRMVFFENPRGVILDR